MEYLIQNGELSIMQKLEILTDAAKYDVACTSSGVERKGDGKYMGNCNLQQRNASVTAFLRMADAFLC